MAVCPYGDVRAHPIATRKILVVKISNDNEKRFEQVTEYDLKKAMNKYDKRGKQTNWKKPARHITVFSTFIFIFKQYIISNRTTYTERSVKHALLIFKPFLIVEFEHILRTIQNTNKTIFL